MSVHKSALSLSPNMMHWYILRNMLREKKNSEKSFFHYIILDFSVEQCRLSKSDKINICMPFSFFYYFCLSSFNSGVKYKNMEQQVLKKNIKKEILRQILNCVSSSLQRYMTRLHSKKKTQFIIKIFVKELSIL